VKKTLALGKEMFLAGEIERREAVSKPTLKNAFMALVDLGFVVHRDDYALAPDYAAPGRAVAIEAEIAKYLPKRGA
jgi:hypothetical protein